MLNLKKGLTKYSQQLRKLCKVNSSFLNANNTIYMEQMYKKWLEDKSSVHPSWDSYFTNVSRNMDPSQAFISPEQAQKMGASPSGKIEVSSSLPSGNTYLDKMEYMIEFFRTRGHLIAKLDPLELNYGKFKNQIPPSDFELDAFFDEKCQEKVINTKESKEKILQSRNDWTPKKLYEFLKEKYTGHISYQFDHIYHIEMREWIHNYIEEGVDEEISKEEYENIYDCLAESQAFSDFCDNKFSTLKRFGADGLDSAISAVRNIIDKFHENKGREVIVGMAHRGRLNVLTTIFRKPYEQMFSEFTENVPDFMDEVVYNFYGDVKYHNGYTHVDKDSNGNEISVKLLPNPSHLEAVNPVVMGFSKGLQDRYNNSNGDKVLSVLVHGDAALAGQGIIYETLQMEDLPYYDINGVVHLVFNNQIGFTTEPKYGRSSRYATNIGKTNKNLIILVNADHPVKVRKAVRMAVEFRNKFQKDVFVDLIGYRKMGHNEQDNPKFTQPVMYFY